MKVQQALAHPDRGQREAFCSQILKQLSALLLSGPQRMAVQHLTQLRTDQNACSSNSIPQISSVTAIQ
ncbi:hypothetical protein MNNICLKF_01530 [Synechococcus sp. CBW1107]|jgi:hypothetical protein|nr:hypothetical protein MNNICLKF_01530 [Synechococcus sp. CBW1107]